MILRGFNSHEDYRACLALQKQTWGESFTECVPPSLLMVSQKIGGVAAGAFDENGTLLGFVFGLTGVKEGKLVHWSDMLAVRPEYRDRGIGMRLKKFQRDLVAEMGVEKILWTYDPLVSRNAHLNLNRLGARVTEYVADMYASDAPGELYSGLSMDRFIVAWDILSPEEEDAQRVQAVQTRFAAAPIVNDAAELPFAEIVRIEIPHDIQAVKAQDEARAQAWRASTRRAFMFYLERHYHVKGFYREEENGRCFYAMAAA
jgi:predicted GNAT superfamily acetyltransferase